MNRGFFCKMLRLPFEKSKLRSNVHKNYVLHQKFKLIEGRRLKYG